MAYEMAQKVLFKHCDPAGIVFFPRYFEMMNDCVEAAFADVLDWPFERMLPASGVPTAEIRTRFTAPSRHGDLLTLRLTVLHLGHRSLRYRMTARCGEELRFDTETALVHVDAFGRPQPWPDPVRARLQDLMKDDAP